MDGIHRGRKKETCLACLFFPHGLFPLLVQNRTVGSDGDDREGTAVAGGGQGLTPQQRETLYAAMNIIIDNLSRYLAQREE